jgi:hypothetical protein
MDGSGARTSTVDQPRSSCIENYTSPNESRQADGVLEEDPELSRFRGTYQVGEQIRSLTAWTTRKDYQVSVGIALPIRNWVGHDEHVMQFWEQVTEPIVLGENPMLELYQALVEKFRERGRIPNGIPESLESVTVRIFRDGKAGYILFESEDSLAEDMKAIPVGVRIDYDFGYARFGMGDRFTLRMLAQEFWSLTQNGWELYQRVSAEREIDGTIIYHTTKDPSQFRESQGIDYVLDPPTKIQEDQGRATAINK